MKLTLGRKCTGAKGHLDGEDIERECLVARENIDTVDVMESWWIVEDQ